MINLNNLATSWLTEGSEFDLLPGKEFSFLYIIFLVYKTKINGRPDPLRWPRGISNSKKLALTYLTSGGGRTVGIFTLWTNSH
jgi:hypothetical protein